jgi:hypothetical protein
MIGRRALLAAPLLAAGPAAAAPTIPPGSRLAFRVMRRDSEIGSHVLDFSREGERTTVRIAVDMAVGIGPLTLYRYRLRVTEIWEGDQFSSLQSEANDDGTAQRVTARRDGDGVRIASIQGEVRMPPEALPLTHWNMAVTRVPVFNPQTGLKMDLTVSPRGSSPPPGGQAAMRHFAFAGEAALEDWYDGAGTWSGLRAVAKDSSIVTYILSR